MDDKMLIGELKQEIKELRWLLNQESSRRNVAEKRLRFIKDFFVDFLGDVFVKIDKK